MAGKEDGAARSIGVEAKVATPVDKEELSFTDELMMANASLCVDFGTNTPSFGGNAREEEEEEEVLLLPTLAAAKPWIRRATAALAICSPMLVPEI